MKKLLKSSLAVLLVLFSLASLAACGTTQTNLTKAQSLADLKGAKIAAQAGTFHADALAQIEGAKTSTYPDFTDLLAALKSGAIDGYIAEEPTALSVCLEDEALDYIHLKNNDTGFTATAADVGIAVGLKTGSALTARINEVLATISSETRAALMEQMVRLSNGQTVDSLALSSEAPASTTGTLKVGMECAYKPFNWTETGAKTTGAVPIYGEGKEGLYANGYDIQIAQYIANKLGLKLEVYAIEWESLIPAVQAGTVDAIIAGMSPTSEREEQIDFTNVYYESNLVIIYKKK
jgi:ABC-type amino acid transport substrate-binding protein